jgi:16S rRNA (uracil1498-N3)-methyltransferase
VQKAVEAGVHRVIPVVTARTVKLGLKIDRLAKIAQEAAEQGGRGIVPEISEPIKFKYAIKLAAEHDVNYFFDAEGEEYSRPKLLSATVGVWIGPEGGWEDFEIEAARQSNFVIASLGKLVLRAETAATVAVYLSTR